MMTAMTINLLIIIPIVLLGVIFLIWRSIQIVPQSENYVVERFGKYHRTLKAGVNYVIPGLENVAHKIIILERTLPEKAHEVITKDNVPLTLAVTIFFKITNASKSIYRIQNVTSAVETAVTGAVRATIGSIDFDEVQSHRASLNMDIAKHLSRACTDWGVDVTRTEILDVEVDDVTKIAMQQQLNAEREKRAAIAKAEGVKKATELEAEGELFAAQRSAEATVAIAKGEAKAVEIVALAINNEGGQAAVEYDILKKQVDAMGRLGSSDNAKTIIIPAEMLNVLGAVKDLLGGYKK
ncbi:MAG: SPFH domain-containing protein [Mariprofundaceae bacterium]|nr:SPFH domain-containing protein [Mariprofundaceae bacterium]